MHGLLEAEQMDPEGLLSNAIHRLDAWTLGWKRVNYFLDGYFGYNQISVTPEDQENTNFACPYGTFELKRMTLDYVIVRDQKWDKVYRD